MESVGSAYGIRTRVTAVRGRRPGPLDECAVRVGGGRYDEVTFVVKAVEARPRRRNSTSVFRRERHARSRGLQLNALLSAHAEDCADRVGGSAMRTLTSDEIARLGLSSGRT